MESSIIYKINNKNNNDIVIIFGLAKCKFILDLSKKLQCKNISYKIYYIDNFFNDFSNFINKKYKLNSIPAIFFNKKIIGNYYDCINFFNL